MIGYIAIIWLILVVLILGLWVSKLEKKLDEAEAAYKALDKGMDEQRESYEQEYLTHVDQVKAYREAAAKDNKIIAQLYGFVDRHKRFCPTQYAEVLTKDDEEFINSLFPPDEFAGSPEDGQE